MPRHAQKTGFFRFGRQTKPALVWLLLLDLSAHPNFPAELAFDGFKPYTDMSECLLICQVAYLMMYFIFACILASSEHLCNLCNLRRLHHQSPGHVPSACVLDDAPSATWGDAVQVWGSSVVLPLDLGHPIRAADDPADDARFRLGWLEPAVGDPALDHARQVG